MSGPVFDAELARLTEATPEQIAANPERFQPVGDQTVLMLKPDGKGGMVRTGVSAAQAQAALAQGYAFPDDATALQEREIRFHQQQYDGAVNVAAGQALNQLLGGVPDIVASHHDSPEEIEGKRRAREDSPIANFVGGAAGVIGGAVATGAAGRAIGLGARAAGGTRALAAAEQAAPGMAARVLGAAGRGAAEGALQAAPATMAHLAYGDVRNAAENIGWGVGVGGILGLGAGAFSEGLRGVKGVAREQMLAAGLIDDAGVLQSGKLRDAIGLNPKGLEGKTAAELRAMRDEATAKLVTYGEKLDDAIAKRQPTLPGLEPQKPLGVVPSELAAKVQASALETRPLLGAAGKAERAELEQAVRTLAEAGSDPVTFKTLNELERKIGRDSPIAREVNNLVRTERDRAMNEAFSNLGLQKDLTGFLATKEQLTILAQGAPLAQMVADKATGALSQSVAGAVGGFLGNAIGGPVGGLIGYKAVRPIAEKLVQHAVGNPMLRLSQRALGSLDDPSALKWLGTAMAKQAVDSGASHAFSVPRMIATAAAIEAKDPIKGFLGGKANGLSKPQQFAAVTSALQRAQADQAGVAHEAETMGVLFGTDPELARAVAEQQKRTVDYLAANVPRDPRPPVPFRKAAPWQPSAAQKAAFAARLEVAQDPWSVMQHVAAGTLRKEHVEALRTLYPGIHQQIVGKVAEAAHDPKMPGVKAGTRHALSRLTGVNLTNRMGINYQAAYAQGQPQKGAAPPEKPRGPGSSRAVLHDTPGLMTPTARREFA